ncbi:MAG: hypothetical protein WBW61_08480 [Rhodanobacteraceae bacterium]
MMEPIRNLTLLCGLFELALLSACGHDASDRSVFSLLDVHDTSVTIHATGVPDATVGAAGNLRVGDTGVAASESQRAQLSMYFVQAQALQHDGLAVGKAGAKTAMRAIGSVVSGLAHGDSDRVAPAVDAEAEKIEASVDRLCTDLHALKATQDKLAATMASFKPYALIDSARMGNCR